jgi:catechol 2,3-dioxygenase-like lactoylglutathione lyase family enzyme
MRVDRLDHLVLTVRDPDATCVFYRDVLGMEVVTFADNRRALRFGAQKINLHMAGNEFEPKADRPTSGSADLCFITEASTQHVRAHLATCGVAILEGPVVKTGALGPITSIYCRDPDGNLIEISRYEHDPSSELV